MNVFFIKNYTFQNKGESAEGRVLTEENGGGCQFLAIQLESLGVQLGLKPWPLLLQALVTSGLC